jgi:hypothetical protein
MGFVVGADGATGKDSSTNMRHIGGGCTRVAPKVMPPICFHGNYNNYKEHNNAV